MEWTNRDGNKCIYNGEADENGLICGEGVAFGYEKRFGREVRFKYEFTCLNG